MSRSDDEVLVKVEGVSKKFCRSLKKSLWYGVCDIAGELLPGRKHQRVAGSELRVAREEAEVAGSDLLVASEEGRVEGNESRVTSQNHSASGADTRHSPPVTRHSAEGASGLFTSHQLPATSPTGEASLRDGEFWAVQDVSFELRRGECLGLIGHNGAGKTTLLKMLNGLIKPDRGSITMRGRVGALIALGAGFNPILTGRENIYINGSVLGLTKKEIDEKIDEIIDFAEIREFIDMPVQSYSSGMTVRLGFAVATAMNPDVLILDEVLAVGDGSFRHKCYQRIDSLRSRAAIIFVSHNMPDVGRICQSTAVMERGRTIFQGNALDGIARYNELNERGGGLRNSHSEVKYPISEFSVEMPERVGFNEPLDFKIKVVSDENVGPVDLTVALSNSSGAYLAVGLTNSQVFGMELKKGVQNWKCRIANIPLRNGAYPVTAHLINRNGTFIALDSKSRIIKVEGAHDAIPGDCQLEITNLIS
jgi:lipopolysaccharide transport system ATP-binding protein